MQVLTKFCCFGQSMDFADNPKYVKRVTPLPAARPCFPTEHHCSCAIATLYLQWQLVPRSAYT